MQQLTKLFTQYTGKSNPSVEPQPSSGSNRRYYRLTKDDISLIGVAGRSREENHAFIELSRHFHNQQLNTPEVLAVSDDEMFYIQQDLGDSVLFDAIKGGRLSGVFSADEKDLLHKTIAQLADFQVKGAKNLNFDVCYPQAEFNNRSVYWDLNYFKYNFLKTTEMEFQEDLLENDFDKLAQHLLQDESDTVLYRDFQSRNVMLVDGNPYFIDYQGGRQGALPYDVASLLYDDIVVIPDEQREELLDGYICGLQAYRTVEPGLFRHVFYRFVLVRLLQAMVAFGLRGLYERKPHFIDSIQLMLTLCG